jgi:hypothetical protein
MKVIAVVGSGSGSGKTALVCRLLRSLPGLGAVKISPRETASPGVEWGPGAAGGGKDTARYAAAGAVRVARVVAPREEVPGLWGAVEAGMEGCRGLIVEGSRSLEVGKDRFGILVVGGREAGERPERIGSILGKVDLVIVNSPTLPDEMPLNDLIISHKFERSSMLLLDVEADEGSAWDTVIRRLDRLLGHP